MHKNTFDIAHLRKYNNGELSPKEMHEIERASHEDEMLMDILKGMELESKSDSDQSALMTEIRQQITQLAPQYKPRKPLWQHRSLQIAASIVVLLTAAGILFWNREDNKQHSEYSVATNNPSLDEIAVAPSTQNDPAIQDSTTTALEESDRQEIASTRAPQVGTQAATGDRTLTLHEKHILAYTPAPKSIELSQDISGTLNLGHPQHENDVIIINTEAADDRSGLLASNADRQAKSRMANRVSSNPNTPLSSAQMRARLSTMGLDPRADFMSVQVIDQKSGKPLPGASVKDAKNESIIETDSNGRFSYATANKTSLTINAVGYKSKEITTETGVQTILLSPLDNGFEDVAENSSSKTKSTPSNGMGPYTAYLRKEVGKLTHLPYEFSIQMELDKKGAPVRINILKSSDSSLNSNVIALIEKGPLWKRGSDWKKIALQLKSE